MSLFAVKNDEGKWLEVDRNGSDHWQASHGDIYSGWFSANERASVFGGHVVELVEAPAKVVVSQEEADMLEKAKHNPTLRPSFVITEYSDSHKGNILGNDLEDRLMRAYVNGWTVEKQKRYFVRVPHANRHYYYQKCDSGEVIPVWDMETEPPTQFTAAEIEHYGLQDCEKVVVTDSAKTTGEEDYD